MADSTCGWQVKLCDPSLTRANLSALETSHYKALYKSAVTYLLLVSYILGERGIASRD